MPRRDRVEIKFYGETGDEINAHGASRYHIRRAVEARLRRLNTDRAEERT